MRRPVERSVLRQNVNVSATEDIMLLSASTLEEFDAFLTRAIGSLGRIVYKHLSFSKAKKPEVAGADKMGNAKRLSLRVKR